MLLPTSRLWREQTEAQPAGMNLTAGALTAPAAVLENTDAPLVGDLDRSFVRALAWSGSAKWASQLFSWMSTIVVARLLAPDDYGIISMAMVFVGFVALLSEFGVGTAVIALRDLTEEQIAQLNGLAVLIGIVASLATCAVAGPLGHLFVNARVTPVVLVLSVGFIISSFSAVPSSLLQRDLRFRDLALIDALRALILAAITVVFAMLGFKYWTLVLSNLLGTALGTGMVLALRRTRIAWPSASLAPAIRLSRSLIVNRVCWYLYSNADFVVAGRQLGQAALGYYTLAWTLTNMPIEKVTSLATAVTPAYLSAVQNDRAALRRYLLKPTEAIALIAFPLLAGLCLLARDAVGVVLGHKWDTAVVPLQILAFYATVRSLTPLLPPVLIMTGEASFVMWNAIAYALVMPASFYIGSHWGLAGVASAWVIAYPIVTIPMYGRVLSTIELPGREYLRALMPAAVSTGLMVAALLVAQMAGGAALPPVLRLSAGVGLGGLVYLGSVRLLFKERLDTYFRVAAAMRTQDHAIS